MNSGLLISIVLAIPGAAVAQVADTIYSGGEIITVNDAQPTAEAVAVKDGRILAAGAKADVFKTQGDGTILVDLKGKTLTPGFIDGHAHIAQFGTQAIGANLLAAPDGKVETIDDLIAAMKKQLATPRSINGWKRYVP